MENKRKKAKYQRDYLDGVKERKKDMIYTNKQGEILSTDMKYPPSTEQMANAEREPVAALMNFVTNTGLRRFSHTSQLIDNWSTEENRDPSQPVPDYIFNLANEVTANVSQTDINRIVQQFLEAWNIEAKLFACASCGIKEFEMGEAQSHQVPLHQLEKLLLSKEEVENLEKIPPKFR